MSLQRFFVMGADANLIVPKGFVAIVTSCGTVGSKRYITGYWSPQDDVLIGGCSLFGKKYTSPFDGKIK